MPIYDFKCLDCGSVSELLVRGAAGRAVHCPDCGSANLQKQVGGSYIIRGEASTPGTTCCGRAERCEAPPCSTDDSCRRR
jgi:putative FmdB family regulatory protein